MPKHISEAETILVRLIRSAYSPVLKWSLSNRKFMVGLGMLFLVITGVLATRLGSEFMPCPGRGELLDSGVDADDDVARCRHRGDAQDA